MRKPVLLIALGAMLLSGFALTQFALFIQATAYGQAFHWELLGLCLIMLSVLLLTISVRCLGLAPEADRQEEPSSSGAAPRCLGRVIGHWSPRRSPLEPR